MKMLKIAKILKKYRACSWVVGLAALLVGVSACGGKRADAAAPADGEGGATPAFVTLTAPGGPYAPDGDSLYALVERQVGMGPRNPGSKGAAQCADWLVAELRARGCDTVVVHPFEAATEFGGPFKMRNILGRFRPDAPRRVLLLAHYDTRPVADQDDNPAVRQKPIPGANDGASGVAVLLEIARLVGRNPLPQGAGLDLLMVDGEDSGTSHGDDEESWCLGTQHWVAEAMPYASDNRPRAAVLFDMVGGRGARFHREQISDAYARGLTGRLWQAAADMGMADRFPDSRGGAVVDDHIYINRAGIPCVDVIESLSAATGGFPSQWHTHADDLPAIDPSALADAARLGMGAVLIFTE